METVDAPAVDRPIVHAGALVDPEILGEDGFAGPKSSVRELWPKMVPDFAQLKYSGVRVPSITITTVLPIALSLLVCNLDIMPGPINAE